MISHASLWRSLEFCMICFRYFLRNIFVEWAKVADVCYEPMSIIIRLTFHCVINRQQPGKMAAREWTFCWLTTAINRGVLEATNISFTLYSTTYLFTPHIQYFEWHKVYNVLCWVNQQLSSEIRDYCFLLLCKLHF